MTDPIADMLTRLRNASAAKHETVEMPYSKFKANIAEILKREGYIKDFTAKEAKVGQTLEVTLKYGPNGERSIQGIKRISKPGLRRYAKSDALPMPLGGLGIAIISTSSGLLTQKECLDRGIGGEIVRHIVAALRALGIDWIGLVGEPGSEHFYEELGFTRKPGYTLWKL